MSDKPEHRPRIRIRRSAKKMERARAFRMGLQTRNMKNYLNSRGHVTEVSPLSRNPVSNGQRNFSEIPQVQEPERVEQSQLFRSPMPNEMSQQQLFTQQLQSQMLILQQQQLHIQNQQAQVQNQQAQIQKQQAQIQKLQEILQKHILLSQQQQNLPKQFQTTKFMPEQQQNQILMPQKQKNDQQSWNQDLQQFVIKKEND